MAETVSNNSAEWAGEYFFADGPLNSMRIRKSEESNAVLQQRIRELEERSARIGRGLSNETLQLLAVAHLEVEKIQRDLAPDLRKRLARAHEVLEQIESQLTAFANELHPKMLDDLGLQPAIEYLAHQFSMLGGIPIRVESSIPRRIPSRIGLTLHRAVEEALRNVLRHARASSATIYLEEQEGMITCTVQDDGVGFDASEVLAARGERGLGLIGIRNSAKPLGGRLTIRSTASGTRLHIALRYTPASGDSTTPARDGAA